MSQQQHRRQVASLLHDELQCVSVSGLSTRFGVSKSQAADMLRETAKDSSHRNYQANYVVREQELVDDDIPCTVFRLMAEPYKSDSNGNDSSKSLYSLAMLTKNTDQQCESLTTAHERDMAHYRDLVADHKLATIICEAAKFDIIEPSKSIRSDYDESIRDNGKSKYDDAMEVETASAPSALARGGPKKVTTAASFFNSKPASSNINTKKEVAAKAAKTVTKPTKKTAPIVATKSDEKENADTKKERKKSFKTSDSKVGHVDDFVGDEDSDDADDDSFDAKLRSQQLHAGSDNDSDGSDPLDTKPSAAAKSNKKSPLTIVDSDDESVAKGTKKKQKKRKDEPVVSGAMDAFATKKEATTESNSDNAVSHKRRRKKLVEKTTMDASGYLHTETQEIWEDIPTDEDEPIAKPVVAKKAAPKAAVSKKNTASMKQGSLMGFFKKK